MFMAKTVVGDIEIDHECGTVIPSVPLVSSRRVNSVLTSRDG